MNEENINENEEFDNIITLKDEDGNEVKFEFLDLVELNDEEYVILLPVTTEGEEEEGEVVILQIEDKDTPDDEEESYISVEDESILNQVFEIFKEKFKNDKSGLGGWILYNPPKKIFLTRGETNEKLFNMDDSSIYVYVLGI